MDHVCEMRPVGVSVGMIFTECKHGCGKMGTDRVQEKRGTVWRAGIGEKVVACAGEIDNTDVDECSSCGEEMPLGECKDSRRPCGHHCNHSWSHDHCDWCGAEFGEI